MAATVIAACDSVSCDFACQQAVQDDASRPPALLLALTGRRVNEAYYIP